jgi:hypothetical protein
MVARDTIGWWDQISLGIHEKKSYLLIKGAREINGCHSPLDRRRQYLNFKDECSRLPYRPLDLSYGMRESTQSIVRLPRRKVL